MPLIHQGMRSHMGMWGKVQTMMAVEVTQMIAATAFMARYFLTRNGWSHFQGTTARMVKTMTTSQLTMGPEWKSQRMRTTMFHAAGKPTKYQSADFMRVFA